MGLFFFVPAAFDNVRQDFLELLAIHLFFILSQSPATALAAVLGFPAQPHSVAGGLFGSAELEQIAQFHARLVQL
jgi:hypothetical protein